MVDVKRFERQLRERKEYLERALNRFERALEEPASNDAEDRASEREGDEVLESLGLKNITVAPAHRIEDGINAVRVLIPKCWFDATKCTRGIDALRLYRAAVDDKARDPAGRPLLRPHPVHDWTSHAADSFRYLALTLDRMTARTNFNRRLELEPLGIV